LEHPKNPANLETMKLFVAFVHLQHTWSSWSEETMNIKRVLFQCVFDLKKIKIIGNLNEEWLQ
jgi:hypothetical protein